MLTQLSIQGLAIVESVQIEFGRGFNVITGETGAGKSILIKALGLLHGAKAHADSVRQGFDQANIAGHFLVQDDHPALKILEEWGIACDGDSSGQTILIRRQITAKGRSQSWVNETPVTSTSLKHLGDHLIDVFGQHENHRLLDANFHTKYLDQFLQKKALLQDVESSWKEASKAISDLRKFVDELKGKGKDLDYLSFRLNELTQFDPSSENYAIVKRITEDARSALVLTTSLQKASQALHSDEGISVAQRLREVARALSSIKNSHLEDLAKSALDIAVNVDELSFRLDSLAAQVDISEEDIDRAEERLSGYQNLFRKHGVKDIAELVAEWSHLKNQTTAIDDAASHVGKLLTHVETAVKQLSTKSAALTKARKEAAVRISRSVEEELSALAMPSAKFSVHMEPVIKPGPALELEAFGKDQHEKWLDLVESWSELSEQGAEKAQFYLASNAGEPSLPLAKVASGGEVSRIMLAIKRALVVGADTCVLVFDEIDTGISGRIADVVGQKIAELSGFCQVICISHLPQVAAYAKTHYIVEKSVRDSRTQSRIRSLSQSEHLDEIARLLSGDRVTKVSLSHAESLVAQALEKLKKRPLLVRTSSSKRKPDQSPNLVNK